MASHIDFADNGLVQSDDKDFSYRVDDPAFLGVTLDIMRSIA